MVDDLPRAVAVELPPERGHVRRVGDAEGAHRALELDETQQAAKGRGDGREGVRGKRRRDHSLFEPGSKGVEQGCGSAVAPVVILIPLSEEIEQPPRLVLD